eukprot:scaffold2950_cov67-Phaeocystis_antarctica.AAC.6
MLVELSTANRPIILLRLDGLVPKLEFPSKAKQRTTRGFTTRSKAAGVALPLTKLCSIRAPSA